MQLAPRSANATNISMFYEAYIIFVHIPRLNCVSQCPLLQICS